MNWGDERFQFGNKSDSFLCYFFGFGGKLRVPNIQRADFVGCLGELFQKSVTLFQYLVVFCEGVEICFVELGNCHIHEAAAVFGCFADKFQFVGVEENTGEVAEEFGHAKDWGGV